LWLHSPILPSKTAIKKDQPRGRHATKAQNPKTIEAGKSKATYLIRKFRPKSFKKVKIFLRETENTSKTLKMGNSSGKIFFILPVKNLIPPAKVKAFLS
jgi:hypothetical protein